MFQVRSQGVSKSNHLSQRVDVQFVKQKQINGTQQKQNGMSHVFSLHNRCSSVAVSRVSDYVSNAFCEVLMKLS